MESRNAPLVRSFRCGLRAQQRFTFINHRALPPQCPLTARSVNAPVSGCPGLTIIS